MAILETNVAAPSPSPFLKLPLEVREIIYRMLLTTSCTYVDTLQEMQPDYLDKYLESNGRFNLSPAILQVNKQISTEATSILYTANDFIFFDIEFVDRYLGESDKSPWDTFERIPAFRRLSEKRVANPVLRVTIGTIVEDQRSRGKWITLITTPEAMPRLFDDLWHHGARFDFHKNWFFALDFRCKAPLRHKFLTESVLKTWGKVHGFGEITVTGDIDTDIASHLKQPLDLFPSEDDDVVCYMNMIQSRAEGAYRSNDFAAAHYYWFHLQNYWDHLFELEIFTNGPSLQLHPQTSLGKALMVTATKMIRSDLGLLKTSLRYGHYKRAVALIRYSPKHWLRKCEHFTSWCESERDIRVYFMLRIKFALCRAFAIVAQGEPMGGSNSIKAVVNGLRVRSDHCAERTYDDIHNEICNAIDNELIQAGIAWRCGRAGNANVQIMGSRIEGGRNWQLHTGCLSFWDWLEIPDGEPATEYLTAGNSSHFSGS
jgi:hypothetical protein